MFSYKYHRSPSSKCVVFHDFQLVGLVYNILADDGFLSNPSTLCCFAWFTNIAWLPILETISWWKKRTNIFRHCPTLCCFAWLPVGGWLWLTAAGRRSIASANWCCTGANGFLIMTFIILRITFSYYILYHYISNYILYITFLLLAGWKKYQ